MGKKNITFSDIAKYTGFSKTTISRYFNNPDSLTLENQQIIATALEKLNYKKSRENTRERKNRVYRNHYSEPLYALLFRNLESDTEDLRLFRI